jgi:hypothetical protein
MSDDAKIYELYMENAAANEQPQMRMDENGDKTWHLHGELHRKDGAAVELANGTKYWFLHGALHRVGAPAVEYANGAKHWWLHGKRHREDGAAVELASGHKYWYLHDKFYADADAWAQALLKMRNEPHDEESVQKFVRMILTKDDLL